MLSAFSNTQKGIFCGLLGYFIYVISDAGSKFLAQSYPILMVVGWMYLFALLTCVAFSPIAGGFKRTLSTKKLKIHIGRGLFNFGLAVSVVTAFAHLPMTSVYPVLYLAPLMVTTLAVPIYKEHVTPLNWGIIAMGFSGVLVCFRPWTGEVNLWIISAFITICCISGLALLARKLDHEETLLSLSFYPNLICSLLLIPYSLMFYPLPQVQHLPIFILGGIALSSGLSLIALAYRLTRFAYIAPVNYLQLIPGFLAGYIIFGEIPDLWIISGSLIIIASGLILAYSGKKPMEIIEH